MSSIDCVPNSIILVLNFYYFYPVKSFLTRGIVVHDGIPENDRYVPPTSTHTHKHTSWRYTRGIGRRH